MINLFVGFDPREEVGSHVFNSSVLAHTTEPVTICHLHKPALENKLGFLFDAGSNDFTVTRFLIPHLMNRRNEWAIFVDGADMVCQGDLAELYALRDPTKAVMVVKHDYQTKAARKYIGTKMEAPNTHYERKNWASAMLINCGHYSWPDAETIARTPKIDLLQFKFLPDERIGELPVEWNWLADEMGPNDDAKLLHWTQGIPGFNHYANAPHAATWQAYHAKANYATP